eukprot:102942-Pelagomonas_calceolata.AAC.1
MAGSADRCKAEGQNNVINAKGVNGIIVSASASGWQWVQGLVAPSLQGERLLERTNLVSVLCCCIHAPNHAGCAATTGTHDEFKLCSHLTSQIQGLWRAA